MLILPNKAGLLSHCSRFVELRPMHASLIFPLLGDLPNAGIEPMSLISPALAGGFFTTSTTWEAQRLNKLTAVPGLARSSNGKEAACDAGNLCSILGSGRSSREGNGNPLNVLVCRIP